MKSFANAFGGTTARACDSCVKRRARWYCAADDAFLCQACDGSVHSANSLARRHERVRLKSASFSGGNNRPATRRSSSSPPRAAAATWHHGFTRKARTPRGGSNKKINHRSVFHDLVPEIGVDDQMAENYEEEETLIYRVPEFDPFGSDNCKNGAAETKAEFLLPERLNSSDDIDDDNAESCLNGFFPTDMELAEFAADVETLLGHGLETESFAIEELGLTDGSSDTNRRSPVRPKVEQYEVVEVEEEKEVVKGEDVNAEIYDDGAAPFELRFDDELHEENGGEKVNVIVKGENDATKESVIKEKKKVLMLNLNYEAVILTWGGQGPPWADGEPPEFDLDDEQWPVSMDDHQNPYAGGGYSSWGRLNAAFRNASGREARVSRYREKRRTRLFSKKIRYEVRKLNAEKRPRMKGRFVKRASLAAASSSFPMVATK